VLDVEQDRIDELALAPVGSDVPGYAGDARVPDELLIAGLAHPRCSAVIALTDDDETNLAVVMTAALLRPDLRVFAQTFSAQVHERMKAFGTPVVIDPFDRFGDYLRAAIRSPASFRLIEWLSGSPGSPLPPLRQVPRGRWIVCGYGRFGRHVAADLRAEGMEVTIIEPGLPAQEDAGIIVGYGTEPAILAQARPETAVGFIAATDNDTANLSMIAAVRAANPRLFLIARQNEPSNRALFRSIRMDFALIPSQVVAHEILAHLASPLLYRFLESLPGHDDAWSTELLRHLTRACGERLPQLWRVRLDKTSAPALAAWFAERRPLSVGTLLGGRSGARIPALVLLRVRGEEAMTAPGDFVDLAPGDDLLVAGHASARRAFTAVLASEVVRDRVLLGVDRPAGWLWRRLARARDEATPT
jgi:Trk K+ transport system NAD-binding subunit